MPLNGDPERTLNDVTQHTEAVTNAFQDLSTAKGAKCESVSVL